MVGKAIGGQMLGLKKYWNVEKNEDGRGGGLLDVMVWERREVFYEFQMFQ